MKKSVPIYNYPYEGKTLISHRNVDEFTIRTDNAEREDLTIQSCILQCSITITVTGRFSHRIHLIDFVFLGVQGRQLCDFLLAVLHTKSRLKRDLLKKVRICSLLPFLRRPFFRKGKITWSGLPLLSVSIPLKILMVSWRSQKTRC